MNPSDAIFWWGFACGVGASFVMSAALLIWLYASAPMDGAGEIDEAHGDYPNVPEKR